MNSFIRTLCVSVALTVTAAFAADSFEGKVSLTLTQGQATGQAITYAMKGQKLRMEMSASGQSMAAIMDLPQQQMLMLMPDQQMYMVMPIKSPTDTARQAMQQGAEIKKTGRTEKILGYECDEYVATDHGTTTEIWLASGLGTFMGLGSGGNPMMGGNSRAANSWEEQIKGKAGFPLRVTSKDAQGKTIFKMEATAINPGSLPDSLFTPPANYQKFAMPSIGDMPGFPR